MGQLVPATHWVWGPDGWMAKEGVVDFAGRGSLNPKP
jgi:ammonia channel protein AmtB